MRDSFTTEGLARGVMAFVLTLRHTAGCSKEEVKHALHPKLIDMIFKLDDERRAKEKHHG
ncbi:hypothetical protein [Burkholderia multivorans]|uniref:hypothetical protein n=1 Tax=Burkholderia multivorans TaxID=87883 RepID=UPI000A94F1FD|nr:hypothetical protein [Burkholderia multivorans]